MNIGKQLVHETLDSVVASTGYRSAFTETDNPQVSRFVRTLEAKLKASQAKLLETSDPNRDVESRRTLPRGDWPYSMWQCPDASIVAVFEARAEVADSAEDLIRFRAQPGSNLAKGQRYLGHWNGEDVADLAQVLHTASARLIGHGNQSVNMDNIMLFGMMEIPYSDRVPEDHPLNNIAMIHAMDTKGRVLLSSDATGPLYAMPVEPEELRRSLVEALEAASRAGNSPIGQRFAAHHAQVRGFLERASEILDLEPLDRPMNGDPVTFSMS